MKKTFTVLTLIALLVPVVTQADAPDPGDSQEAKWEQLAQRARPGPCPTKVEVLPYIWIEPSTGIEYTALRLHCPGRDDLEGDPATKPGA